MVPCFVSGVGPGAKDRAGDQDARGFGQTSGRQQAAGAELGGGQGAAHQQRTHERLHGRAAEEKERPPDQVRVCNYYYIMCVELVLISHANCHEFQSWAKWSAASAAFNEWFFTFSAFLCKF